MYCWWSFLCQKSVFEICSWIFTKNCLYIWKIIISCRINSKCDQRCWNRYDDVDDDDHKDDDGDNYDEIDDDGDNDTDNDEYDHKDDEDDDKEEDEYKDGDDDKYKWS